MGLTCSCDHEPDPGQTLYYGPSDYAPLDTKRRRLKCTWRGRWLESLRASTLSWNDWPGNSAQICHTHFGLFLR